MKKNKNGGEIVIMVVMSLVAVGAFWGGWWWRGEGREEEPVVIVEEEATPKPLPLLAYTLPYLAEQEAEAREITLERVVAEEEDFLSLIFTFEVEENKKMSGLMNLPKLSEGEIKGTILLLRGWAPLVNYVSGTGTKNVGIYLARRGYQTLAPDFLGYGESDSEGSEAWQVRLAKPWQMKQLLANIRAGNYQCREELSKSESEIVKAMCEGRGRQTGEAVGIWGHSNGGQIALSLLEIMREPIPTVLWAPVAVGFPYSVLFFTDEEEDEGKKSRKFVSLLEEDYDTDEFSHTQNLNLLAGGLKIQLHHGVTDEAALVAWSDELVAKIKQENEQRAEEEVIEVTYYRYREADHNLRPVWDEAVAKSGDFFEEKLGK